MALRALVVEDDDFTRLMISTSLRSQGIDVVFETSEARKAIAEAMELKPEIAILDLHIGKGPTGLDVASALRRFQPDIGILILTSFEDPKLLNPNLPRLPDGGVYVTKNSIAKLDVLMDAIDKAVSKKGTPPSLTEHHYGPSSISGLSDTQLETLRLMALGLSNSEIAKRKFVTEKSVENSIARLAKAMNLTYDPGRNQRVHMAKVYFRSLGIYVEDNN